MDDNVNDAPEAQAEAAAKPEASKDARFNRVSARAMVSALVIAGKLLGETEDGGEAAITAANVMAIILAMTLPADRIEPACRGLVEVLTRKAIRLEKDTPGLIESMVTAALGEKVIDAVKAGAEIVAANGGDIDAGLAAVKAALGLDQSEAKLSEAKAKTDEGRPIFFTNTVGHA